MKLIRNIVRLDTPRLILRQWQPEDYSIYAGIAADPLVMEYFPQTLSHEQSANKVNNMRSKISKKGWGFWAVELKEINRLIGLTGLNIPQELPFIAGVEIGWQYASPFWGKGYATEAASAALDFAFNELELTEVVAFTSEINSPSRAVMHRLGMIHTGSTFSHPAIPEGNPLRQHVLYKISNSEWREKVRGA